MTVQAEDLIVEVNQSTPSVYARQYRPTEAAGSRETVVVPIADEQPLYYYEMVRSNIEKVDRATQGRVGYVHIPDMGVPGLNEFVKNYYPQLRKEALIVDVRGNGGGNVSPMIVERLRRELAMVDISRNAAPSLNPDGMVLGLPTGAGAFFRSNFMPWT